MFTNYPSIFTSTKGIEFTDGFFVKLPKEYRKISNKLIINSFYSDLIDTSPLSGQGSDPIGFDYYIYNGKIYIGLLLGLTKSKLSNDNRKKYPNNKFSLEYISNRIKQDFEIQNFETHIPIKLVTQNIHELRNLNFKISSSIDEILNFSDESDWEMKFDKADENIKKIYVGSRLTKFILDNLRLYSPNYIENLKPNLDRKFSIHRSVSKIVKIYSNDFKKQRIKIQLDGLCYRQISGDKELFEIIMMLLIENSIKYSIAVSSISPRVKINELTGDLVVISIQSYGNLIPDEEKKYLFTKEFRASIHKSKTSGTGMGLHNASKLIEIFGGKLSYRKEIIAEDNNLGWNCFEVTCEKVL